jgi:hypothetical protein
MRLTQTRVVAATAATLTLAVGIPVTAGAASASTTGGSAAPAAAKPASQAPATISAPVTGTFTDAAGQGTFKGTFIPTKFSVVNNVLEATGVLKGTLTDANGTSAGTVSKTVTMNVDTPKAVAHAPAACTILNLTLGPLNLNLLGLVVQLNQVHLVITAVPGAGNLLGNLLCGIANLLNGGSLSALSAALNALLALL